MNTPLPGGGHIDQGKLIKEKKAKLNEQGRRVMMVPVAVEDLLQFFTRLDDWEQTILIGQFPKLPPNAKVEYVHMDHDRRALIFRLSAPGFPLTPDGAMPPYLAPQKIQAVCMRAITPGLYGDPTHANAIDKLTTGLQEVAKFAGEESSGVPPLEHVEEMIQNLLLDYFHSVGYKDHQKAAKEAAGDMEYEAIPVSNHPPQETEEDENESRIDAGTTADGSASQSDP